MAIVLQVGLLLDPNNQIAHLVDFTGLTESIEYVISAPFLQADTRFTFQGHFDIALTRPPVGVPQSQTEVPATISTVPMPAAATPPARYPYTINDRLIASNLNLAFDFDPGVVPPAGNGGGAGRFKYWVDTSGTLPVLRQCVANPRATPGVYVPSQWIELGSIDAAANKFHFNTDHVDFGGGTSPVSVGSITAAGPVITTGPNAALVFTDRNNPAIQWLWYAAAGTARLYSSAGDRVTVDSAGSMAVTGNIAASGVYVGGGAIYFNGNSNTNQGPFIFSDNTNILYQIGPGNGGHYFRSYSGFNSVTFDQAGRIYAQDSALRGNYIYFAGGGGAVNTTGGPLIYADNNNHVYKQGSGNGSWLFQNYAGVNVASLNSAGDWSVRYLTASANVNCWDIYVGGTVTTQVVTASGTVTGGYVVSTGNVQANNAFTGGAVSVSGAVTGNYIHSTGTVQADGVINAGSHIDAGTYVYAPDGLVMHDAGSGTTYRMYSSSGISSLQFADTYAFQWHASGGQLNYIAATNLQWVMRIGDYLTYNAAASVGGLGAYINLSDRRGKTDIVPSTRGLDEILRLSPVEFKRVSRVTGQAGMDRRELGFIAQDVQGVLPEAVRVVGMTLPDGTGGLEDAEPSLGITDSTIVVALVNAVKELHVRLEALEA